MNWVLVYLCGLEKAMALWEGIAVNLCSDVVFIAILAGLLYYFYHKELVKYQNFFGLDQNSQVQVYISTHEDNATATKGVVTAVEYEVAAELKYSLQEIRDSRLIKGISGILGQEIKLPELIIKVSPLEEGAEALNFSSSLILIGGPLRNQVTQFYLQQKPLLTYDKAEKKYKELNDGEYRTISRVVAILVKMNYQKQTVFLAFGDGEIYTAEVVRYLKENWKSMSEKYTQSFGLCFSPGEYGKLIVSKEILPS